MRRLYLDDNRTPIDNGWIVVRDYKEFTEWIMAYGIPDVISFDHDLADEHMEDFHARGGFESTQQIKYGKFKEKTGFDCAKWLVQMCDESEFELPKCYVHSANPIGAENIISFLNCYLRVKNKPESVERIRLNHKI